MCDGRRFVWDDKRLKPDLDALLDDPDLEDQLSQAYPLGQAAAAPAVDHDPGRIRVLPFFEHMYGGSPGQVRARLRPVRWLVADGGRTVLITSVNGVDKRLQAVADELSRLPAPIRRMAARTAGSFVWRRIARTKRWSAHSWGIAIDIGTAWGDYWGWEPGDRPRWRNRLPMEIVYAFERHGFIWGGRWYHFDTPHFEYRPELLLCRPEPLSQPLIRSSLGAMTPGPRSPPGPPLRGLDAVVGPCLSRSGRRRRRARVVASPGGSPGSG
jgi:hypothetical protein